MIILICGLPNAGKTTYSAQFETVVHLDDFHQSYRQCNAEALKCDGDVCVEGIYNKRKQREEFLEAFSERPGPKVCIWLDTDIEECCRRENRGRSPNLPHVYAKRFEPPTLEEGWDEIRIVNANN